MAIPDKEQSDELFERRASLGVIALDADRYRNRRKQSRRHWGDR